MDASPAETEPVEVIRFLDSSVQLRPLRAADRELIEELVLRTEPHDLRMRFCGAFRRLPPEVLDHLMRIDTEHRVTLVASAVSRGRPEVLAVTRAHRTAPDSAEFALLVRSDLKGLGLGSLLLGKLISRCRERGIRRLIGEVLRVNAPMLRLAARHGFREEALASDTLRLILDLEPLTA